MAAQVGSPELLANDRAAVAAGQPALINFAFGLFLLVLGTPIYFFYKRKRGIGRIDPKSAA